jgi:hypothetical protein
VHVYKTNFVVDGLAEASEQIEFRNPSGSGVVARILTVQFNASTNESVWVFRRYPGHPTHGTGGDAPTAETIYQHDSAGPASAVEVYSGPAGSALLWPLPSTAEYVHTENLFPLDSGDDKEVVFAKYWPAEYSPAVRPGESMSLESQAGEIPYVVTIMWEETPALPVEIASAETLPAAGAYTAHAYFDLPEKWRSIAWLVEYTAAVGSTGARPKARVSWSCGGFEALQPIVETTLDVSAPPTAARSQYFLEQRHPSAVSAGQTITLALPFDVLPGATGARLDLAELGDVANPGTVTVAVTGA